MNTENKQEDKNYSCYSCQGMNNGEPAGVYLADDDKPLCQRCIDNKYYCCDECSEYNDYSITRRGCNGTLRYCENCWDDIFFSCDNCGSTYNRDDAHTCCDDDIRCGECCYECNPQEENSVDISDYYREYSTEKTNCTRGKRMFAFEVECNFKNTTSVNNIYDDTKLLDLGIEHDGSLGSRGVELITPVLAGTKGLNYLKHFCKQLKENEFSVDSACGLHIHIDGKDFKGNNDVSLQNLKKLALFYLEFENVVMSFIPESRRKNRYCLPISESFTTKQILNCYDLESFETLWYKETDKSRKEHRKSKKYDDTRYAGINFHSLLANGHLEIRYHTGTVNYEKMMNWAKLHICIMNSIKELSNDIIKNGKYLTSLTGKTDLMFKLIKLDAESIAYFKKRQKLFNSNNEDDEI
jgi:hypothetical protein